MLSATLGVEDPLACLVTHTSQSPVVVPHGPPSTPSLTAAWMACSKFGALAAAAASAAAIASAAAVAGSRAAGVGGAPGGVGVPPSPLSLRVRWVDPPRTSTARPNFVVALCRLLPCVCATAAALTLVTADGLGRGGCVSPAGVPPLSGGAGGPARPTETPTAVSVVVNVMPSGVVGLAMRPPPGRAGATTNAALTALLRVSCSVLVVLAAVRQALS